MCNGGIFLLKSICIKTNNKNIINYLLKELEYFDLGNIYISVYKFKLYQNIIIHYTGKHIDNFLKNISTILAYTVVDFYEPSIIKKLVNSNYFYFSDVEKKEIYNLCLNNIDFTGSIDIVSSISNSFFDYLSKEHSLILDGFVNFRLHDYIKILDSLVDMSVNKFIIDREYHEFINLLKLYISSSNCTCDVIHLIYKNEESILLDGSKNVISLDSSMNTFKYLSDISFSSNDFALNTLLSLLPAKLYIHIIDKEDDFINTLKLIFDNRVFVCNDCSICNLYKLKAKV